MQSTISTRAAISKSSEQRSPWMEEEGSPVVMEEIAEMRALAEREATRTHSMQAQRSLEPDH